MENRAVSLDQSTLLRRARGSGMPPTVDERQLSRITKPQALRLQNWAQFELHISVKPACFFSPSSSQSFHFASSPNVNSINITRILAHGSPIDISVAEISFPWRTHLRCQCLNILSRQIPSSCESTSSFIVTDLSSM